MNNTQPLIFCAIDTANLKRAVDLARAAGPVTGGLKLGMEFINSHGPQGIEAVCEACPEAKLFIDLKFHDIPNTVAGAVHAICERFNPAYINVHAAGGLEMMRAAKEACAKASSSTSKNTIHDSQATKLLAVTILTSLTHNELCKTGYAGENVSDCVERLALLAQEAKLDGVVCSAHEIEPLRTACGSDFALMVPGIRPEGSSAGDQKRVMTPKEAMQLGANHLVIGRPITESDDPAKAAQEILESI